MKFKVGYLELIPIILACLFLALMIAAQISTRYFGIVTNLTLWAESNVMLPILFTFAAALSSILIWTIRNTR